MSDIMEGVRRIKATDGPDLIVWGSSTLTPVLLEQGLDPRQVKRAVRFGRAKDLGVAP